LAKKRKRNKLLNQKSFSPEQDEEVKAKRNELLKKTRQSFSPEERNEGLQARKEQRQR